MLSHEEGGCSKTPANRSFLEQKTDNMEHNLQIVVLMTKNRNENARKTVYMTYKKSFCSKNPAICSFLEQKAKKMEQIQNRRCFFYE